jgi:hypothetical protein
MDVGHRGVSPNQIYGENRTSYACLRRLLRSLTMAFAITLTFLLLGGTESVYTIADALRSGLAFGSASGATLWVMPSVDVDIGTLIANSPQLALSVFYMLFNNILTSICLSSEYADYGTNKGRKGLRVSSRPIGAQRTAYFLQVPLKFGIPLVTASSVMHWIISQSLYLVKIDSQWSPAMLVDAPRMRDAKTNWREKYFNPDEKNFVTLGWSPLGVVLLIVGLFLMMVSLLACGFLRFKSSIPVASSCSAAISAACHLGDEDEAALRPYEQEVQWGVSGVKHCSFSSLPVREPIEGEVYL